MNVWRQIVQCRHEKTDCVLLCVVKSEGSSPGRAGFKMLVRNDGKLIGTIGGGIMEHKFVKWSKKLLKSGDNDILLKKQIHSQEAGINQSGMICSGEQWIAIIPLFNRNEMFYREINDFLESGEDGILMISANGLQLMSNVKSPARKTGLEINALGDWQYIESLKNLPRVHIIGAGHVGLAVSKVLNLLNFELIIYDERADLHTLLSNDFVDETRIVDYQMIGEQMTHHNEDYVIVVTSTYRTDKLILKQLIQKDYFYLGCMGSEQKMQRMFNELRSEGISEKKLDKIKAPIGLNIYSKTAEEIGISIAAQIIYEKNKHLPTGRTNKP